MHCKLLEKYNIALRNSTRYFCCETSVGQFPYKLVRNEVESFTYPVKL